MARKNNDFKRKVMPYILLAFSIISMGLILMEIVSNIPATFGG